MRYSNLNYFERKAQREANAEANAAARAARKAATMHCQCCGRDILANRGKIAHHGYQRPGYGWQTPSCMGAAQLPFEVARDALGRMITMMRDELERRHRHRALILREARPIVYSYHKPVIGPQRWYNFNVPSYRRQEWPTVEMRFDVTRTSFDAFKKGPGSSVTYGQDYDDFKTGHLESLDMAIENLDAQIAFEQKRYDGWVQTHQRRDNQWVAL